MILNNLVVAYTQLDYPALAWQAAQELARRHPDFPDAGKIRTFAELTEEYLHQQAAELLGTVDLPLEERIEVLVQHDRVRFYTDSGQVEEAIVTAESLLQKIPDLVPILNNLSLSHFVAGNTAEAIAAAERALAQAPENFHALSNLTRFNFLTAHFDAARQYAARLEQLRGDNPDLPVKQAEALAFLGDDEGVREAYQRAKEQHGEQSPLLLHLAAAAHYRLGDEKTAWRLWQDAVDRQPSFLLAQRNLNDRHLPVGQKNAPWYWPLPYWFSGNFQRVFTEDLAGSAAKKEDQLPDSITELFGRHPHVLEIFPHMLERGDGTAREFVINLARLAETPELGPILYDYALSRHGADQLRMEAIQVVTELYSHLLPEDKKVMLWLEGEQKEIFLSGFEIHWEPEPFGDLADEILDMHEEAHDLLVGGQTAEAEQLLKQIIDAAPDFPSPYNQLAVAYQMQGRQKEARALVEETHARFPDYLFARVALARFYARQGRIEEAKDLLDPIIRRRRLHIAEFRALAQAQMEIALADGRQDAARSWLDMWTNIEEDHPDLPNWRKRIEGSASLLDTLQELATRAPKRRLH